MTAKHPDVKIDLLGQDGNIYNIMGIVTRALWRAGHTEDADEYVRRVTKEAQTYEEALAMAFDYVEHVEDGDDEAEGECWTCGVKTTYDDTVCEDCDVEDDDDF